MAGPQSVVVNEVYRALPINCNFTIEHDKLMQLMHYPYILRCLSLQASLGFKDHYSPRTLPSSVSWAILHLRHASLLFTYFLQYNRAGKDIVEPHDPGEKQLAPLLSSCSV
jgi:mediator of RNA polymerase II transcription subunit 16, fungi type